MITSKISNWDVELRLYEGISGTSACQNLVGESVILLDTSVKRTVPSFLTPYMPDTCKYISKETIPQTSTDMVSYDQTMNGWIAYVREEFYSIPEVEVIYVAIEDKEVDIWLLIPNRDLALLRRLVDLEMKILDRFVALERQLFLFEFHIVYRCGAEESLLVPQQALRFPR